MHMQPVFEEAHYFGTDHVAEKLFDNGLCLPSGSNLTDAERTRIAQVVNKVLV
jgi:dTDP-4-amino-4,6-dideoxygalactose transaminase